MSTQFALPDSKPVPVLPRDPSQPLQEAERQRIERKKAYGRILEYIKNTCKSVETEDESARLNILGQQNKCQAYYDDRQYGKINDRTGEWEDLPPDNKEFRPQDNKYKEQVDKLQMEMARSATDLNVEPVDQTDSAMLEAARFFKSRVDANRKRLFTQRPEFVLSEHMALLLKTITYRYVYFDQNAKDGPREKRPVFEKQSIGEEKTLTVCAVCGAPRQGDTPLVPMGADEQGMPGSFPPGVVTDDQVAPEELAQPCPTCGSQSIKTLSTSPVELELPVGEEEYPCGLPRCVHADPTMVQVSLNARNMAISSSPYLVWTQMVERGKLEQAFPDMVIPSGSDDTNRQLEYRRDNEVAVSNSSSGDSGFEIKGGEQFEKLKFKLIWLDSWIYGDYESQQDEKLPNGQILPKGTKLITLFPRGLCIAKVGDTPLALYDEDKNKKWSVCVYGLREGAWHGSGTNALLPLQLQINDLLGFREANVYFNTFTREFFRKEFISGENLPGLTTACAVTDVPDGRDIVGGVYDRAPGTPLPPEVPALSQELQGSLQEQAGTSSMSTIGTAAQQEGLGTATGIAYMRDMAVGRMGPNLMLKAAMEVETAFQIAELEQNNYSKQQLLAFAGLKPGSVGNLGYTMEGVEAFINSDIRADFLITPTPGSWMPETEQQKKADALAMADASGKVQDPELLANIAKIFKQPMSVGGFNATQREAARRIEEFGKVVQIHISQGYVEPTPEMAQAVLDSAVTARLSVEMDSHSAYLDYHRDWWTSDEARNASPLLRLVVETRQQEHKAAMIQQAQEKTAAEIESQEPARVAQEEMAAKQQAEAQAQQEQSKQDQILAATGQEMLQERAKEHDALIEATAQGQIPLEDAMMLKEQIAPPLPTP